MPVSTKVIPVGSVPAWDSVGAGEPVAATANEPGEPAVNVVPLALMIAGADAFTVKVKLWVASGDTPFVAVTEMG